MNVDAKAYRHKLIETFRTFAEFCEKEGLMYMVCGGSCIGAVRDHGVIPWDDDVDVFMPRCDFDRLLSMRDSLPEGYAIARLGEDNYSTSFPKFYDANTTLWEEESLRTIVGVYVDIFPLDEFDGNYEECRRLKLKYDDIAQKYRRSMRKWTLTDILRKAIGFHVLGFRRLLLDRVWYSHFQQRYLEELKAIQQEMASKRGELMLSYDGAYGQKEICPKAWFADVTKMKFEYFEVNVPVGYHEYLTQLYGNYMTPPPPGRRASTHSHFYLNLDRGMTLEEVCNELGKKQ